MARPCGEAEPASAECLSEPGDPLRRADDPPGFGRAAGETSHDAVAEALIEEEVISPRAEEETIAHTSRKSAGALPVDEVDLRILEIVGKDGRVSVAALAEKVGISRANAYARMERLRDAGVIEGFAARVNAERVGLGLTALIFLKVNSPAREELSGPIRDLPGIEYCAFITGEHDVVLIARAPDVATLRERIMVPLTAHAVVRSTHTVMVLDEILHRPFVLPRQNV